MKKTAFRFFVLLLLTLCVSSCQREEESLPASIVALTKTPTACDCEPYVDLYRWKGQLVYVYSCRGPLCLCGAIYYNEKGEAFEPASGISFNRFSTEAKLVRQVWRCGE